jgi:hypothetical protein
MEETPMATIIYNCKGCKKGKRVEYPIGNARTGFTRIDSTGTAVPAAVWIQSCGGGRPTVYGGDIEMGICATCHKMMSFGTLKAFVNPDHKCDARCTSARGHNCECSCGGVNHGVAA